MRATLALLALLLLAVGCEEPQLGDVPFYCNKGSPECPEGYRCQTHGKLRVCVREGATYAARPDAKVIVKDAGKDEGQITFDGIKDQSKPDLPGDLAVADGPVVQPDLPKPPDQKVIPKDAAPAPDMPHWGCQSNNECKLQDPQFACCCPLLNPLIWGCLPFCLNPLCVSI